MIAGVEIRDGLPHVDLRLEVVGRTRRAWTREDRGIGWALPERAGAERRIVDADDDARDRVARLSFAAADGVLNVLDVRVRVAELGRDPVGPGRIETGRIIFRVRAT